MYHSITIVYTCISWVLAGILAVNLVKTFRIHQEVNNRRRCLSIILLVLLGHISLIFLICLCLFMRTVYGKCDNGYLHQKMRYIYQVSDGIETFWVAVDKKDCNMAIEKVREEITDSLEGDEEFTVRLLPWWEKLTIRWDDYTIDSVGVAHQSSETKRAGQWASDYYTPTIISSTLF